MRWQTTAVLAVVLLLLGGFYYVYEVRWGPAREEAAARRGRVFQAETADVTALALRRGNETVRIERQGDEWRMVEPVKARASRVAVDEVLANVLTAKIDREIEAAPASLDAYGLTTPAASLTLTLKDGRSLGLDLGARSPTGVWVYARERDKPAVFVLGESVLREATRPVGDLRDRTIVAFDDKQVSGFEVVLPDTTLTVERADERWRIVQPVALPADRETVSDLFSKLTTQRIKEFVAEGAASRAAYGLDRPVRLTIHSGADKDRSSRTLLFGRVDQARQGVYAMRPGEDSVLLLPEEVWKAVPKNVAVLRDKVVFDVRRDKVARLEIESPKGTVAATRDKEGWKIVAPEALPADQVEVGAVLTALDTLRAQGFLTDDATGIPRYLARPQVKVTVTEEGGASRSLLLAPSRETRGGAPSAYAAVAGAGPVVLVDAKALTDLAKGPTELRDRRLLAGVEARDVQRMRVSAGGQTAVLERDGDFDWRMLEPSRERASSRKVDDLLYALRGLRWKSIVSADGADAGKYGLETPAYEVVLLKGDGSELATVHIGRRDGATTYVRKKGAPPIYAVDSGLGELPKVPEGFKDG
ncbi:MAG TPA: DUF4340 domain-containing protein [Candidatus Tectomicrobia bacterium]|nr:DUF4340 domain-containing protein [Candidatus Tectomicrobia bacterium]